MSQPIKLTPAALNKYIKNIIESDFYLKSFDACGEISNLKYHSNGNIYFAIKDDEAQINCVMFKYNASKCQVELKEGMKIEISGSFYLYVKGGSYSINVTKVVEFGIGDLFLKFNALKHQLEQSGLFKKEHKHVLPRFPKIIGVLTSPTGAAVKDIIVTLNKRYPIAKIVVVPTLVQGDRAKYDICEKIKVADSKNYDVLILGRGGGSIEDLWAFNEEMVARAIYECKTPIISSVGHETDTTIADYVADVRALTPTDAAVLATVDISELNSQMQRNMKVVSNLCLQTIFLAQERLNNVTTNQYFTSPLIAKQLQFDQVSLLLDHLLKNQEVRIENELKRLDLVALQSKTAVLEILKIKALKLDLIHEQIDLLNPLTILSRGYSQVYLNNSLVKSVQQIKLGDSVDVQLTDARFSAIISQIPKEDSNAKL